MASRPDRDGTLIRWIDAFLPEGVDRNDVDTLLRLRLTVIASSQLALIQTLTAAAMMAQGHWPIAVGNLTAAGVGGALLWLLHRGIPASLVANFLVGSVFLFVAGTAGLSGGAANSALHTTAIIPAMAVMLGGTRQAIAWGGVCTIFVLTLWWLRSTGFEFPVQLDPATLTVAKFPGTIALMIGVSAIVAIFAWLRDRARLDLEDARREAEHAEHERLRLEARIQQSQRLESLGVLAGGVAHDFNNLLSVILGNASQIQLRDDEASRALARDIEIAGEQASSLTGQLLSYAGRGELQRSPVLLPEVVERVSSLARAALASHIGLHTEDMGPQTRVMADAQQLQQVVLTLVTNAGEAIEGSGSVSVRTGAVALGDAQNDIGFVGDAPPPGNYAFLEVEDDGAGMSEEIRSRVFEPFFTTKKTGRGLGLSALLGIVRSHGGYVHVESEPLRGTRIRVLLDIAPD